MKIVHAADLHVDSPMGGLVLPDDAPREDFVRATRRAFENLVQFCLDEQVALLVLAGDLFDGDWRDFNTGVFVARQLGRLQEVGASVVAISGNHDAASVLTRSVRWPGNVRFLDHSAPETARYEHLGLAVHGQSYATKAVTANLAAAYPQALGGLFNIGLLHTSAKGASTNEAHEPYAPCGTEDLLAKGYQYWALGHVHERQELSADPVIAYPGNTQGRNVRETGPRGCTLLTLQDGRLSNREFRSLDVVRWANLRVDAASATTRDDLVSGAISGLRDVRADADGRPIAARVVAHGATALHASLVEDCDGLRADLEAGMPPGVWLEEVKIQTSGAWAQEEQAGFWSVLAAEIAATAPGGVAASELDEAVADLLKATQGALDLDPVALKEEARVAAEAILRARLAGRGQP